ncbi:MAG: hypothetical protein V3R73_02155 [Sphingomonadales bacterium]
MPVQRFLKGTCSALSQGLTASASTKAAPVPTATSSRFWVSWMSASAKARRRARLSVRADQMSYAPDILS